MLVDVKSRVCRGEDFGPERSRARRQGELSLGEESFESSLVDVVDADRLQDLCLDNVTDTRLGHNLELRSP